MLERQVENRLVRGVQRRGGLCLKLTSSADRGAPDRLVIMPGGVFRLVEVKADGGRVSPAQVVWHGRAAKRGIRVDIVVGAAGVDEWLGQWGDLVSG